MATSRMKTSCRLPAPTGTPASFCYAPLAKPLWYRHRGRMTAVRGAAGGTGCRGRSILMIGLTPSRLRLTNQLTGLAGLPAGAN